MGELKMDTAGPVSSRVGGNRAARATGVVPIGFASEESIADQERLTEAGAARVVTSLAEVEELLPGP